MTNQNLSFVSALTGSLLTFGPVVCAKACRTSGLAEISSAVSTVAINLNSKSAGHVIVEKARIEGVAVPVAQAFCLWGQLASCPFRLEAATPKSPMFDVA